MKAPVLIKLSGKAVDDQEALGKVCTAVAHALSQGQMPVLLHGGGQRLNQLEKRLGREPLLIEGRRVTDAATLEAAKMAFAATGLDLCAALTWRGLKAIPLPAGALGLVVCRRRPPVMLQQGGQPVAVDYGLVGDIVAVNADVLRPLLQASIIPVIASLGLDSEGQYYNINADTVAARLAAALGAAELQMVSDVPGILSDVANPLSLIHNLSSAEASAMLINGQAGAGMKPKIEAILTALAHGVPKVRVLDASGLMRLYAPSAQAQTLGSKGHFGTLINAGTRQGGTSTNIAAASS